VHNTLYVPKAPMGLLCPQQIAMQTQRPGDGFNVLGHAGILTVGGFTRTIPYDPKSRLPILPSFDGAQCYLATGSSDKPETVDNISKTQSLLLNWHNRQSRMSFQKLQDLARQGKLPEQIIGCQHPICRSCQYGNTQVTSSIT
jgi:hypothetical protein